MTTRPRPVYRTFHEPANDAEAPATSWGSLVERRLPGMLDVWAQDLGPRAFCDPEGRIVWKNYAFDAFVSNQDILTIRNYKIHVYWQGAEIPLAHYVHGETAQSSSRILACRSGAPALILTLTPVEGPGDQTGLALKVRSLSPKREASWSHYADYVGLTQRERQIVNDLLDGKTASAIASARHQSIDTVRTHIRNIYLKMGVCSREALMSCLFRYMEFDD